MESLNQNLNSNITFDTLPKYISILLDKVERLEGLMCASQSQKTILPKYVDINGASEITSKSPNALRVQISLGNLKAIKKGSRNYFDREYLENWIAGIEIKNV